MRVSTWLRSRAKDGPPHCATVGMSCAMRSARQSPICKTSLSDLLSLLDSLDAPGRRHSAHTLSSWMIKRSGYASRVQLDERLAPGRAAGCHARASV